MPAPELNLLYVHSASLGYGRLGVKLHEALSAAGVDVYDHLPGENADLVEHLNTGEASKVCSNVCWVSVPTHAMGWWENQRASIFTMWEATKLPPDFRQCLHNFETIVVPSWHNVELFSAYHENVAFVPLGIDPLDWHYVARMPPTARFRFLIAGSGKRKGTDLAYKAFRKAFPRGSWASGPEPWLVMKNPRGEDFYGERIEMVTGRLSGTEEQELYASAHCYVQPSRGEGFGLQPLQAIAQGCPTILTNAHGHESFAHLGYGVGTTFAPSDYFIYGDAGDWWEPDLDELVERMRYVYENYEASAAWASEQAKVVADRWTWAHTAKAFVEALGLGHLCRPLGERGGWQRPEVQRFRVRVNRAWAADIVDASHQWLPGRDYWELADVKRILFEAGILDPACITGPDTGLAPSQQARIEDYSATHAYCITCHQPLNAAPTRADELFEAMA